MAVAIFFLIIVGAVIFLATASARTNLYIGLGLSLVELASIIAFTATGWQGQVRGYPLVALGLGWLAWNVISGACLAMYVFSSYSPSVVKGILLFALLLAPAAVSIAGAMLADKARHWSVTQR